MNRERLAERSLRYVLRAPPTPDSVENLLRAELRPAHLLQVFFLFGGIGRIALRLLEPVVRMASSDSDAWLRSAALVAENSPEGSRVFYQFQGDRRTNIISLTVWTILELPALLVGLLLRQIKRAL